MRIEAVAAAVIEAGAVEVAVAIGGAGVAVIRAEAIDIEAGDGDPFLPEIDPVSALSWMLDPSGRQERGVIVWPGLCL